MARWNAFPAIRVSALREGIDNAVVVIDGMTALYGRTIRCTDFRRVGTGRMASEPEQKQKITRSFG